MNPFGEFVFMNNGERIRTYILRNTTKEHYYKNRRNADQITSELDKVTTL